jgi:transposase
VPHDTALHALPDDPAALKQRLAAAEGEVQRLKLVVDKLTLQLARRLRSQFGASSERFDDGQTSLIEPAVLDELPRPKPAAAAANTGTLDRTLPDHLPREPHEIRPEASPAHHDALGQPCGCTACGGRLRTLGADVAHHLEYMPGRFKVIRTVRPKLACTKCEAIFQAPAPSRPIPRGLAGAGLLAHVAVSKYCDSTHPQPDRPRDHRTLGAALRPRHARGRGGWGGLHREVARQRDGGDTTGSEDERRVAARRQRDRCDMLARFATCQRRNRATDRAAQRLRGHDRARRQVGGGRSTTLNTALVAGPVAEAIS